MFPVNLWLLTRVLFFAHAAAGALGTRSSLRPLTARVWFAQPLGRDLRRENADLYPHGSRLFETKSFHRRPGQASDSERRSGTHSRQCSWCAKLGPLSFLRQTPVVMGPGFRQDDVARVCVRDPLARVARSNQNAVYPPSITK